MIFLAFITFLVLQRLIELFIARSNERWLRTNGAIEYGQRHYPFIVLLHTLFVLSLIVEYAYRDAADYSLFFLGAYLALVITKVWVIASLGTYWNTKIFRIPDAPSVRKGLYKFVRHPNYIIVVCEIAIIPLIFHLYFTAVLFSILNAAMLRIRIREENRVWSV